MVGDMMSFTGNGLKDWFWQRITAVFLGIYALSAVYFFAMHPNLDYPTWFELFHKSCVKVFSIAALLAFVVHAWIGVWTVSSDYLKCAYILLTAQLLLVSFLFALLLIGIAGLWSI